MVFFQTKVTNIITIYYISLQKIFLPRLEKSPPSLYWSNFNISARRQTKVAVCVCLDSLSFIFFFFSCESYSPWNKLNLLLPFVTSCLFLVCPFWKTIKYWVSTGKDNFWRYKRKISISWRRNHCAISTLDLKSPTVCRKIKNANSYKFKKQKNLFYSTLDGNNNNYWFVLRKYQSKKRNFHLRKRSLRGFVGITLHLRWTDPLESFDD